jgi:hypothetical protein
MTFELIHTISSTPSSWSPCRENLKRKSITKYSPAASRKNSLKNNQLSPKNSSSSSNWKNSCPLTLTILWSSKMHDCWKKEVLLQWWSPLPICKICKNFVMLTSTWKPNLEYLIFKRILWSKFQGDTTQTSELRFYKGNSRKEWA